MEQIRLGSGNGQLPGFGPDRLGERLRKTRLSKLRATITDFSGFLATEFNNLRFACRS